MPERTIRVLFYTTLDGDIYQRGETVELSDEEADRGDELGAFVGNRRQPGTDPVEGAFGNEPRIAGPGPLPEGEDPEADEARRSIETPHTVRESDLPDATMPSEMSDDEIDGLTGQRLDDAIDAAGIDASQGGSLSDGSMSADEKRQALKEQNAAARG